ncbi:MAG: hypothetical protein LC637_07365, partial [Xanthomonadaceae bacterium]|nr:hypothetical protein [Xanthomonadaceae bacterium]
MTGNQSSQSPASTPPAEAEAPAIPKAVSDARAAEQARLETMQARLDAALREVERRMRDYNQDVKEQKEYMWEHRREMDFIEKIASRQSIEQSELSGDAL